MSAQAKTLEDLKDSRIMFDKEIPPFGYMLVLIVFFTMAGITVWSTFAHKAYMVRAEGSITSSDSNYVMPSFTGEIAKSYMEEGKLVQKGDVLFVVKSLDFDLQEEQLADSQENYEEQIAQYDKLIKSIKEDTNYFDAGENKDSLYYSMFENYKAQVAQNEVDTTMYKSYGYTDEQIESELVKAQSKKSELYYTALQTAENARKELENQLESAKAQLSAVGNGKNEYEVKAHVSEIRNLCIHELPVKRCMAVVRNAYLSDEKDLKNPYASPLFAQDLANSAPAIIITPEYDRLRLEGEAYARRLAKSGVPTTVVRYRGINHGFTEKVGQYPQSQDSLNEIAKYFNYITASKYII